MCDNPDAFTKDMLPWMFCWLIESIAMRCMLHGVVVMNSENVSSRSFPVTWQCVYTHDIRARPGARRAEVSVRWKVRWDRKEEGPTGATCMLFRKFHGGHTIIAIFHKRWRDGRLEHR